MAFQGLFMPSRGGELRRWMRIRKDVFLKRFEKSNEVFKSPVTLFDFTNQHDAADVTLDDKRWSSEGWRAGTDQVIGGFSKASLQLIRTPQDFEKEMHDSTANNNALAEEESSSPSTSESPEMPVEESSQRFTPFVRWKGTLDTRIGERSRVSRSGYCAIQTPSFPFEGAVLNQMYNALEISCRSDGRTYAVNMKILSYFPDELYQGYINVPALSVKASDVDDGGEFATLVMPFRDFALTSEGRLREEQRSLDGAVKIENIGFTLMDGKDGPFQFDLARIRAVNYYNGEIIGESE